MRCHAGAEGAGVALLAAGAGAGAGAAGAVAATGAGLAEAAVALAAGVAAGADSAGLATPLLAPSPPLRKSVTYQPEPLSWKPAAVTCLENADAPQAGHTVSGSSEIFCSTSLAWPQAEHL
jgi:hypothetical protein